DDRELIGGGHAAAGDVAEPGVHAFGDGVPEEGEPLDGRQRAAEPLGLGGVHDPVQLGVGAGLGGGQVAHHEVGDVGLVPEVPADGAGVLVRTPDDLVRVEVPPQLVGVGAGAVVLAE